MPTIRWNCPQAGLAPELIPSLKIAAAQYHELTGESIHVVSAVRTLQHQAELMSTMSVVQLEGMYCRNGYPDYIRQLVELRQKQGSVSQEDAYQILSQRSEGYISAHLSGAAVDITPPTRHLNMLKRILQENNFSVLDERSLGVACIHARHLETPIKIVRQ